MRWWIPETIGTSAMDCGPAALASLLRGFGIGVAYDRLREALCTDVDGTSIDRLETVAEALGLDAEQVMLPADVVALPAAAALPAVVVTRLPEGALHFVVVWRRVGAWVQVMDPAVGRRWMRVAALVRQLHRHGVALPAAAWRAWAGSAAHGRIVAARLGALGVRGAAAAALVARAEADPGFGAWAALDAAIRVVGPLVAGGGVRRGREAAAAIGGLMGRVGFGAGAVALPPGMWSVMPLPGEGEPWVEMQGAVLVRVKRRARGGSVTDGMGAIDGMDAADDIPTADGMGATNAIPAADAINAINGMTPDDTPANDAASADIAARG
ncbi:MAG: hypothetical protein H6705_08425, partial [Myxococcales bacterium]|nr:hypothetical protein [Myxococcales bacterium]